MATKRVKTVLLFTNGSFAVLDENGTQIPELQTNVLDLWCEHARSLGYDLSGAHLMADPLIVQGRVLADIPSLLKGDSNG